jgi:hypothetical protein
MSRASRVTSAEGFSLEHQGPTSDPLLPGSRGTVRQLSFDTGVEINLIRVEGGEPRHEHVDAHFEDVNEVEISVDLLCQGDGLGQRFVAASGKIDRDQNPPSRTHAAHCNRWTSAGARQGNGSSVGKTAQKLLLEAAGAQ